MPYNSIREPWDAVFSRLKEFKEKNGHCNAPAHRDKLGRWVEKQRTQYRLKKLSDERIEKLNAIGFQWRLHQQQQQQKPKRKVSTIKSEDSFNKMVEQVVHYVEQNGHGWIPESNPGLGVWAKNRRREKKLGILKKEREDALVKAGFIWEFKFRWSSK